MGEYLYWEHKRSKYYPCRHSVVIVFLILFSQTTPVRGNRSRTSRQQHGHDPFAPEQVSWAVYLRLQLFLAPSTSQAVPLSWFEAWLLKHTFCWYRLPLLWGLAASAGSSRASPRWPCSACVPSPFLVPHCFSSEVEEYPREYFESICFSKTVLANFTNPAPRDWVEDEWTSDVSSRSAVLDWGRRLKTSVVSVRKGLLAS